MHAAAEVNMLIISMEIVVGPSQLKVLTAILFLILKLLSNVD